MANLAAERYIKKVGDEAPASIQRGVDGGAAKIWEGAMVTALTATGMVVRAGTASAGPCIGVAAETVENTGSDGDKSINLLQGQFWFANSAGADAVTEAGLGSMTYIVDDQTVADNSNAGARQMAGVAIAIDATDGVLVYISAAHNAYGDVTESANADDIAELQTDAQTAQAQLNIPLTSFLDADGDPLAKFIDAASPTFGFNLADSEALNLRWNNDATPGTAICNVAMPQDMDDTADVVLHFLCSKSGATVGDATTLDVTAFFQTVAALHDADADAGGTTNALVGNAAAKTVAELTLAIAAADVPPAPCTLFFTVAPTAGLLGTDDLMIHSVWIEYTRKIMTA